MKIHRARKWLTKNKVFFEIFTSVGLGITAIWVSYAAYSVSKLQVDLAAAQVAPQFRIGAEVFDDPSANESRGRVVNVYNDGFPITEFRASSRSLLQISTVKGRQIRTIFIPIKDLNVDRYPSPSPAPKEPLITVTYAGVNTKLQKFRERLIEDLAKENIIFTSMYLQNVITVMYVDAIGKVNARYYIDEGGITGRRLSDSEAKDLVPRFSTNAYFSLEDTGSLMAHILAKQSEAKSP